MNETLENILTSWMVADGSGNFHKLGSNIDEKEVIFLQEIISAFKVVNSIEIGCAMGISSLTICSAIMNNSDRSHHVIIDPFQKDQWKNIGMLNLKKSQLTNYELIEIRSEYILPRLAEQEKIFDFAFIDGWHTFDHTLIDFFYLNRMLRVGGVIVIDDVGMPAINQVCRFIHKYPCYKVHGFVESSLSNRSKVLQAVQNIVRPISKLAGDKLSVELFSPKLTYGNKKLGLNSSMIAFEKIADDQRDWNWHKVF